VRNPTTRCDDAETVNLPVTISDLKFETGNPLRLARRFHRPSGLSPDQRVLLVIATPLDLSAITLNGVPLQPDRSGRFPVERFLAEHNTLAIQLQSHPAAVEDATSTSALDVRIEIED
jgi:hypothetical protein